MAGLLDKVLESVTLPEMVVVFAVGVGVGVGADDPPPPPQAASIKAKTIEKRTDKKLLLSL